MNWEDKVKISDTLNKDGNVEEFWKLVLEHKDEFDDNMWDIFVTVVNIAEMETHKEHWLKLKDKLEEIETDPKLMERFNFRFSIRLAAIMGKFDDWIPIEF